MISRNSIRVKVMQALYEYNVSTHKNPKQIEKMLLNACEDIYRLYIKSLALFVPLTQIAEQIIDIKKTLFFAKEEDLHPNVKFIENQFIRKIGENTSLQKLIEHYGLGWNNDVEMVFVRKIFDALANQEFYIEYMQDSTNSFANDKAFVLTLVEKFFLENETMIHYFSERKLHWQLDYNDVMIMVYNTLKGFKEKQSDNIAIPPLFKLDEEGASEDKEFMLNLLHYTIQEDENYKQIVIKKLQNWEADRIAVIDFILLKMAICEFCCFPSIPLRVTLNEYIEISKYYSTPKSRMFINGLLDKILDDLKAENKINKQGRGLMG
ncbi:MAG: transcription antitermination protein NusB [Bacteroidales bacterium]|jgi:N utilization substance protein B|nr:transcription antitermination protein NusB [Bacteroidales bacterium]